MLPLAIARLGLGSGEGVCQMLCCLIENKEFLRTQSSTVKGLDCSVLSCMEARQLQCNCSTGNLILHQYLEAKQLQSAEIAE